MGRAVKNSLEIIIKQVRLEGGFVYRVYASMHACNDWAKLYTILHVQNCGELHVPE